MADRSNDRMFGHVTLYNVTKSSVVRHTLMWSVFVWKHGESPKYYCRYCLCKTKMCMAMHVCHFMPLCESFSDVSSWIWGLYYTILYLILYCTVLCCAVLCCAALYYTVLYYTILYSTLLYCTILYCTILYCTVLYCTILYCTILYCTVLYCTLLYYTLLYYTVLYYTVLYCTVLWLVKILSRLLSELEKDISVLGNTRIRVTNNYWSLIYRPTVA